MKLIKVVNHQKMYVGKDGKNHPSTALYACADINGLPYRVAIKRKYDRYADGSPDYRSAMILDLMVEEIWNYDEKGELTILKNGVNP